VFLAARIAIQTLGFFAFTVEALNEVGAEPPVLVSEGGVNDSSSMGDREEEASSPSVSEAHLIDGSKGDEAEGKRAGTMDGQGVLLPEGVPGGLVPAGVLAGGWRIDSSGRYRHRKAYVLALAKANGFEVALYDKVVARRRHSSVDAEVVEAHLFVLRKTRGGVHK
jgi:hypothetical protein